MPPTTAFHFVDGGGEPEGRDPLGEGRRFQEGAIDLLGAGLEDAVQANGVSHRGGSRRKNLPTYTGLFL
jgi:hypothetical protein